MPRSKETVFGIFSDNPKMDTSGISVQETHQIYVGSKFKKIPGRTISGGEIRLAAMEAGVRHGVTVTDKGSLQKMAEIIRKGNSVESAANDVAREYAIMFRGEDTGYFGVF